MVTAAWASQARHRKVRFRQSNYQDGVADTMSRNLELTTQMSTRTEGLEIISEQLDHAPRQMLPLGSGSSMDREQIAFVVLGSALLVLAITRQSLWIDEAWTAWFAAHASTQSLLHVLIQATGSDTQFPGYLLYMHAWVNLFGRSEFALRLSNLPFAMVFLFSLSWISTVLLKRPYAWLIVTLSPFLWFYMNEARPYVGLMACSSVVAAAVLAYCMDWRSYHRVAPWIAMGAFTAALAFHMLSAFLGLTLLLFLALSTKGRWGRLASDWSRPVLACLPMICAISAYYVVTVLRGAGGRRLDTGWKNVAFVFYELCGFAGLGPPRNDLRATGGAVPSSYWPMLLLGSVALVSVLAVITITWHRQSHRTFTISLAVGFVIAVLAYKLEHFRFLGRHFAMFFPLALIALLMYTRTNSTRRQRWAFASALALLAVAWAVSDARLILLPGYAKEDYRDAAALVVGPAKAGGSAVLWAGEPVAALYYGVRAGDSIFISRPLNTLTGLEGVNWPVSARAVNASNWAPAEVCSDAIRSNKPLILVLSDKQELYDQNGGWAWLTQVAARHAIAVTVLNGFEIYTLAPSEWRSETACGVA
jgi:hypothetical protein